MLTTQLFGLSFANPVGLAAGFDKNAIALDALLAQGFGFVESGTVTPLPQPGNPKPRIFRLSQDEAVINRLGFNNEGLDLYVKRLQAYQKRRGIVGANIGKNKDSCDAVADYIAGLQAVYAVADYVTVNISSPNTAGLRALQERQALTELLSALHETRNALRMQQQRTVPLLLKIAPDLTPHECEDIAELVRIYGIDGVIVSNTTIERPSGLRSLAASEQGGLSGRPLFSLSTSRLANMYRLLGADVPLIGVGGIASAEDAYAKIRAGASLVQLYTALVYQGFVIVRRISKELPRLLARDGFTHISEAVGVDSR